MTPEDRLKQVQAYISRMPSLSTTVAKVLEICGSANASPHDLNRVISYDPVLTGQVLKLINSAYFSLPNRITSLSRAIIMLGVNTVKNLVLATSVLASFKVSRCGCGISMDAYWAHCLCVGTTAKAIAKIKKVPILEQEEFFVAGLLHDLGKLPMIACFSDMYDQVLKTAENEYISLFSSENKFIGFNHCQVGLLIGMKWKLGTEMQQALSHHHDPLDDKGTYGNLLCFTSLANQIAHHFHIGSAGDNHGDELLIQGLADRIGVSTDMLFSMQPMIAEER
ncbi:MAG: HDOD domain-containing protein, partial [Desulfobacteraceae bacterium]